jgi:PKD repeat protein
VTCTSYDWDFGDGGTSFDSRADEQHAYTRKGNFTVTVTARRSTSGGNPIVGTLAITIQ